MKKVVLGMLLMMLVVASATAQESEKKSRWGLRLTADLMGNNAYKTGTYDSDGTFVGFNWTLLYQCFVSKNWFVEPQFSLYHMNYENNLMYAASEDDNDAEKNYPVSNLKELGLGLAVVAGYSFPISEDFSVDVFIGPELKYAFKCKDSNGNTYLKDYTERVDYGFNNGGFQEKTRLQKYHPAYLNWRAGVELNYHAFHLALSGGSCLTNRLVGMKDNKKSTFISLGIGFKFHGKP
ncbi:MAG: outer membrane beta-barrel protein [Bacteroides sp.]|nr:outer membrane beta-barrel protein [Bacteroides sp.]